MNQCPHCGADITDSDDICPQCGKKIAEPAVQTPPPAVSQPAQTQESSASPQAAESALEPQANASPIKSTAISETGFSDSGDVKKKKIRKRLLLALVAVALVVLFIAALSLSGGDSDDLSAPAGVTDEQFTETGHTNALSDSGDAAVPSSDNAAVTNAATNSTDAAGNAVVSDTVASQAGVSSSVNTQTDAASGGGSGSQTANQNAAGGSNNTTGSQTSGNLTADNNAGNHTSAQTEANPFAQVVEIINSGHYALDGTMTSGSDNIPIGIIFCGDMTRMSTDMDGMVLDMAMADGVIYLINPSNKTYMTLTESLMNMMEMDASDLDTSEMRWQLADASTAQKTTVPLDGQTVDCYTIGEANGSLKIYMSGSEVVQIDVLNTSGNTTGAYKLTSFRGNITEADILPGDDYSSKNFMSFFMDLM